MTVLIAVQLNILRNHSDLVVIKLCSVGFTNGACHAPWGRKGQPTSVFLPRESHGQRNLVGHSPWGPKSRARLKRLNHHRAAEGGEAEKHVTRRGRSGPLSLIRATFFSFIP